MNPSPNQNTATTDSLDRVLKRESSGRRRELLRTNTDNSKGSMRFRKGDPGVMQMDRPPSRRASLSSKSLSSRSLVKRGDSNRSVTNNINNNVIPSADDGGRGVIMQQQQMERTPSRRALLRNERTPSRRALLQNERTPSRRALLQNERTPSRRSLSQRRRLNFGSFLPNKWERRSSASGSRERRSSSSGSKFPYCYRYNNNDGENDRTISSTTTWSTTGVWKNRTSKNTYLDLLWNVVVIMCLGMGFLVQVISLYNLLFRPVAETQQLVDDESSLLLSQQQEMVEVSTTPFVEPQTTIEEFIKDPSLI